MFAQGVFRNSRDLRWIISSRFLENITRVTPHTWNTPLSVPRIKMSPPSIYLSRDFSQFTVKTATTLRGESSRFSSFRKHPQLSPKTPLRNRETDADLLIKIRNCQYSALLSPSNFASIFRKTIIFSVFGDFSHTFSFLREIKILPLYFHTFQWPKNYRSAIISTPFTLQSQFCPQIFALLLQLFFALSLWSFLNPDYHTVCLIIFCAVILACKSRVFPLMLEILLYFSATRDMNIYSRFKRPTSEKNSE